MIGISDCWVEHYINNVRQEARHDEGFNSVVLNRARKLYGIVAVCNPDWLRALCLGVAAGQEHCKILRLLGPCSTVVDIGANRGQFSLAARHVWPDARIFAFEPLCGPAEKFKSVFARDASVRLFPIAIGPETGEAMIHISRRDDSSSLLPIGPAQDRIFPGTDEIRSAIIKVETLDNVLSASDIAGRALLKLDVQGFELSALQGCERSLALFDHIYCECSFLEMYRGQALAGEVISWLQLRGFELRGVYNPSHQSDGAAVQADFLFARLAAFNAE